MDARDDIDPATRELMDRLIEPPIDPTHSWLDPEDAPPAPWWHYVLCLLVLTFLCFGIRGHISMHAWLPFIGRLF